MGTRFFVVKYLFISQQAPAQAFIYCSHFVATWAMIELVFVLANYIIIKETKRSEICLINN